MNKANILFLADTSHNAQAVKDHIEAICSSNQFNWHIENPLKNKLIDKLDFNFFDAIGIHYSIKPYNHYYLSKALKRKISEYQGVKFLFLQDEYQQVNLVQDYLYQMGFDILFTLVQPDNLDKAYPDPRLKKLKKITVLTGYVQDYMKTLESPPIAERLIDISYRSRSCPFWLGALAYEKDYIADEFIKRKNKLSLHLDISIKEQDRVYGENWIKLLQSSKAVLGTESGASIWDFDNSIKRKVQHYLKNHQAANFNEVYEAVLKPYDGKIMYNAISPRVFEAAATHTAMILFPGEYNGILTADKHYICLQKDFSNLDDVLNKLADNDFLQEMVDRNFQELILSDQYSQHQFSKLIEDELLKQLNAVKSGKIKTDVSNHVVEIKRKHSLLNKIRYVTTEFSFMVQQFFSLLLDPQFKLKDKPAHLMQGLKRYLQYLLPRLKNN